jgi:putative DNA primase/helicase
MQITNVRRRIGSLKTNWVPWAFRVLRFGTDAITTSVASRKKKLFPCTDSGNAEMFAALYGENVRFDHKQGRWLGWDGERLRWCEDKTGRLRSLMKATARCRRQIAGNLPADSDECKRQFGWALGSENLYRIDAALDLAKSEEPIRDDGQSWDSDPWLFGVANGIVDLHTGGLQKPTQQHRITKFSPVEFDASATCPRWEHFLQEIFQGDTDRIKYVQKAAGYSLTGSTDEHCLFACYGTGRNGKSTLLELLLFIFGDYGIDLPFSTLETKRNTPGEGVNLPGARFAKSVEIREGKQLDEARIKSWTGGDTISVRPLYRNGFSFQPTHKLWLAFNHKPVIADDSPAMWERVKLIPFERRFADREADKTLKDRLKQEASGILNWAIQGCLLWQQEGLRAPASVEKATAAVRGRE